MAEPRGPSSSDESFAQLRSIILGPEQRKLQKIRARLRDAAAQTRDVSRVLPDALELRAHDPQLKRALAPSVEEAITASVRRNPQALADALFPVIGPAIRKAVAHAFDAMIDSINQTIERSVSRHAVQWRWTAWRTGKPYAEVVIANTLDYRVEQVFLIHRESGLLLQHAAINARSSQDADQISAMLTAITDFARDSFHVGRADTLESLRVGDLAVSIVQGPHAILAAVVRGSIPAAVRASLENALESVHRQFGPALQGYAGDASPFDEARPLLEACLVSQRRRESRKPSYRGWVLAMLAIAVAAGIWFVVDMRRQQRFDAYLESIAAEPGVVVLASNRRGNSYYVAGLRDPMARDPVTLAAVQNLEPAAIRSRWEPYEALHPPFVSARAALLLRPPDGVRLTFRDGVLTGTGSAPQRWIDETQRLAPAIAGVRQFRFEGEPAEAGLVAAIESTKIGFAKGQSAIALSQQPVIESLVAQLQQLDESLAGSRRRARVEIEGYADSDGPDDLNAALSQARADQVRQSLVSAGLTRIDISARGRGRVPLPAGAPEAQHEQNRRASFRVHMTDEQPVRREP